MGIYQKLLDIQKEIKAVTKDGHIETKSGSYKILSHGRVMEITRDIFIRHGVIFYPQRYEVKKDGSITTVNAEYVVADTESLEEIAVSSVGQGSDTQDKGAGKASTYADKYLILRLLRLMQEEDTDETSSDELTSKLTEVQERGKAAKEYLDSLLRDSLVDREYYNNAKKYLDYFISNGDINSIKEAEDQMNKIRNG